MRTTNWIAVLLLGIAGANAQLAVTVSSAKVVGQKAIVSLALRNTGSETVESARAACFLLDEQGKMVGQATKWVIGGSGTNGLPAGATNQFNFVVTGTKPFTTTNLTATVQFNRVVLAGGQVADPKTAVQVQAAK